MRCSRRFQCAVVLLALGLSTLSACSSSPTGADSGPCIITYPMSGFDGTNVFFPGATAFQSDSTAASYELAAELFAGSTLSFTMTLLGDSGVMPGAGLP